MNMSRIEVLSSFGFKRDPFAGFRMDTADGSRVRRLVDMAVAGNLMVSLVGERGAGKTESINAGLKQARCRIVRPLSADRNRLIISDVEQAMIYDLSDEIPKRTKEVRIRQLRPILGNAGRSAPVAVVIEEAHRVHPLTLRALKVLRELEWMGKANLFSVILIGQSDPLGRPGMSEVSLRADVVRMMGLSSGEAADYLRQTVGGVCDEDALAAMATTGNYLDLQATAITAMARALADGRRTVTAADASDAAPGPETKAAGGNSAGLKNLLKNRRKQHEEHDSPAAANG